MATIVNTTEEEPTLAVVRFTAELAWADAGPEVVEAEVGRLCLEAQEHIFAARWAEMASLMLASADLLLNSSRVPDKDLECILFVICNLVTKAGSEAEAMQIAKNICQKLNHKPDDKPALRLKVMNKEYLNFLNKYLATFKGSEDDANAIGGAKEEAVAAIIEFVKSSNLFQCDLLSMPAVAQLEKDDKYGSVYELLKIFLTQSLDSYLEFQTANSTLLKDHGLVHEECVTKMRLMSLLDLSSCCSGEIPYSAIIDALKINEDEVEYWIVKAIALKILDCKVDQLNQTVIVSWHTERIFGMPQWQGLCTKLGVWRGNVASAISTIQANKITEDGTQGMQGLMIR